MIEIEGDLFARYPGLNARVITTNGDVRKDGRAVMGRGVARQAAQRWPSLRLRLGDLIAGSEAFHLPAYGNHVHHLGSFYNGNLVSFPVKHHWQDTADLSLIVQSCRELVKLTTKMNWRFVLMPRPGCGNGGLTWDVVKPMIQPLLDDRFFICQWRYAEPEESAIKVVKV